MNFRTILTSYISNDKQEDYAVVELKEGIASDGGSTGHYRIAIYKRDSVGWEDVDKPVHDESFPHERNLSLITVVGIFNAYVLTLTDECNY